MHLENSQVVVFGPANTATTRFHLLVHVEVGLSTATVDAGRGCTLRDVNVASEAIVARVALTNPQVDARL